MDLPASDLIVNEHTALLASVSLLFIIALAAIPLLHLFFDDITMSRSKKVLRNVGLLGLSLIALSVFINTTSKVEDDKLDALLTVRAWAQANDLGDIMPESAAQVVAAANSGQPIRLEIVTPDGFVDVDITDEVRITK